MTSLKFDEKLKSRLACLAGEKVLVAFSGGKDSSALLDFMAMNRDVFSLSLSAVYINHHLRADAEISADMRYCKNFCVERGLEFFIRDADISEKDKKQYGIEACARKYRYELLNELCGKIDADMIVTAHTLDDQIETFFINLFTSVSIYTLAGIKQSDEKLYRPMLEITSAEVEQYLEARGIAPVFDKSNDDKRFLRNFVRHDVMPFMSRLPQSEVFTKNVLKLLNESDKLSKSFYDKASSSIVAEDKNSLLIDKTVFEQLSLQEREFFLAKSFSKFFRVTDELVKNAIELLLTNTSKRIDLPDGYFFESSYDTIRIFVSHMVQQITVEKNDDETEVKFDSKTVRFLGSLKNKKLILSRREDGDTYGSKKVKDLMIDKKLTLYDRDRLMIIKDCGVTVFIEKIAEHKEIEIVYE